MKPLIRPLDVILRWFLILLAVFMVATVSWQVFSRYALRAPSSLTEEVARFQLIWLGLIGAVYTFRQRMHVGIDILVAMLKGKKRLIAEFISLFSVLVFAGLVLVYGGGKLVALTHELNQTSAALGIRMSYIYSVLPISGMLMCIYAIDYIVDLISKGQIHKPSEIESVPISSHIIQEET